MTRLLTLALALTSFACHPTPSFVQDRSSLARETSTAPTTDTASLVASTQNFAAKVQTQLGAGNQVFSPHSIAVAVAMASAGATGDTQSQMTQALQISLPQAAMHAAFNRIDATLIGHAAPSTDPTKDVEINVANALFGEQTETWQEPVLDVLAQNYGAGISLVDFIHASDTVRQQINTWVGDETNQRITNLLGKGSIDSSARLVLVNAVYMKAAWAQPFAASDTNSGSFTNADGSTSDVPFMHQNETFAYAATGGWQAIELPYFGGQLAMTIVMPGGDVSLLEADPAWLATARAALSNTSVQLSMPKVKLTPAPVSLVTVLQGLGMQLAFTPRADFSPMNGSGGLSISDVAHQAYLAIDEQGTEAAAATAVIAGATAEPLGRVTFTIDHPFVFAIVDAGTGEPLFQGRVAAL